MKVSKSVLAAVMLLAAVPAFGQSYPNRPVRFISPFPPGTGIDIISRAVGDRLSPALGQPVVVENRPGAGGTIGAAVVAKAAPDGYTVLIQSSSHTASPFLYSNLPFDTVQDFSAVTMLAVLPQVLVVAPDNSRGIGSVKDLVAYAKAHPGQLNYASAGNGSATHMADEKFKVAAGIDAVHIPFKGTPEAMTDIMAGRVDYMFAPIVSAMELIKSGKLKAIAMGADKRAPQLSDVPTTAEAGVPNADYIFWAAMFVPSKTPPAVVSRLYQETTKVLQSPEMKERLAALGAEPWSMKGEAVNALVKKELSDNAALIKTAGIQAN
ncbi:MAG TPA: tripartite tricarboxylate transporter substrate binding protein [Alphaproteobacteria bacterium]